MNRRVLGERSVTGVCTTVVAALIAGAAAACEQIIPSGDMASRSGHGFITREWIWSDGASTTTFTAHGPPEQVNSLDPQNGIVRCPDCTLASSEEFGPEDEAALTEVAE